MLELHAIDFSNIWKVIKLSVRDDQQAFVATNTESILEAYVTLAAGNIALPFAICDENEIIGFVMFGYGTIGDDDEPSVADGNYTIWRFMIDKAYQGRGCGKAALAASLDYLRTMPCGSAKLCWLSYEPANITAKALYASFGFLENGETDGDEIVAALEL